MTLARYDLQHRKNSFMTLGKRVEDLDFQDQHFLLKIEIQQEEGQFLNGTPRCNIDTNDRFRIFNKFQERLFGSNRIYLTKEPNASWMTSG